METAALVDRLLAEVSSERRVILSCDDLRAALDCTPADLNQAIAEANGYLHTWEVDSDRFVVLSPYAAASLGLTMSASGETWRSAGEKVPRDEYVVPQLSHEIPASNVGEDYDLDREPAKAEPAVDDSHPRHYLEGLGRAPWPSTPKAGETCPACDGMPVPPGCYCLACDSPVGSKTAKLERVKLKPWDTNKAGAAIRAAVADNDAELLAKARAKKAKSAAARKARRAANKQATKEPTRPST